MSMNHVLPKKIDVKPKKHHGFYVVLVLLGWLLPPLGESSLFEWQRVELAAPSAWSLSGNEGGCDNAASSTSTPSVIVLTLGQYEAASDTR
jgi:hypothetical protein